MIKYDKKFKENKKEIWRMLKQNKLKLIGDVSKFLKSSRYLWVCMTFKLKEIKSNFIQKPKYLKRKL